MHVGVVVGVGVDVEVLGAGVVGVSEGDGLVEVDTVGVGLAELDVDFVAVTVGRTLAAVLIICWVGMGALSLPRSQVFMNSCHARPGRSRPYSAPPSAL